jgi:hypothetical protein
LAKLLMGRWVVTGLLSLYDTSGLPLSDVFHQCQEQGYQPCWTSLVGECEKQGWSKKTVRTRLEESVVDVYGRDYWQVVKEKLEELKLL